MSTKTKRVKSRAIAKATARTASSRHIWGEKVMVGRTTTQFAITVTHQSSRLCLSALSMRSTICSQSAQSRSVNQWMWDSSSHRNITKVLRRESARSVLKLCFLPFGFAFAVVLKVESWLRMMCLISQCPSVVFQTRSYMSLKLCSTFCLTTTIRLSIGYEKRNVAQCFASCLDSPNSYGSRMGRNKLSSVLVTKKNIIVRTMATITFLFMLSYCGLMCLASSLAFSSLWSDRDTTEDFTTTATHSRTLSTTSHTIN